MADGKTFSTPKRRLTIEKHLFQDEKERYKRHVEEHPFNHSVQFTIPNSSLGNALQCFQGITPTQDHYSLIELPVYAFTEVEFIKTFIKNGCKSYEICHHLSHNRASEGRGSIPNLMSQTELHCSQFVALSWETRIDSGNCAAVLPTGVLILSLDKDTYEQLGLTGKPSAFQKKHRFIVEVDLTAPYFVPGKKHYERVRWCLKDNQQLTFKFLMSWTSEGHASADKLNSYFSSYNSHKLCNKEDLQSVPKHQKAPVISFGKSGFTDDDMPVVDCEVCSCVEFFEWLGCIACGIDCSEASPDNFVSKLACPEPSQDLKQLITCRWTGLITTSSILSMLHAARKLLKSGDVPWITMNVWGFTDCPVTWKNNEHGHFLSGENFYTFVIFPDDNYWLYIAMGSHDICS